MRASQLEVVVLRAVEALREGHAVEDDRLEFKRDWPGPDKARQLAGAANRSRGDDLIYVIGIDENTGVIHPTGGVDPANWWSSLESSFDEISPELVRHLSVPITDTERVVALHFRTDRTPYIVRVQNGGATEREVPIRDGTRTRSARRHELLKMLYPSAELPQLTLLEGSLRAAKPSYSGGDADSVCELKLWCRGYFEIPTTSIAFLPAHLAIAQISSASIETVETKLWFETPQGGTAFPSTVQQRWDGLDVGGSGMATLTATWKRARQDLPTFVGVDQWRISLDLGVAGSDLRVKCSSHFGDAEREMLVSDPEPIGRWRLSS